MKYIFIASIFGALLILSCDQVDQIKNELRDLTPHESYFESLGKAGLSNSALGVSWAEAAERAFKEAPAVGLPFEEEGFFSPESPDARSYLVRLKRGQRLFVEIEIDNDKPTKLFVDIYRMQSNPGRTPLPVLSSDSVQGIMDYVASRSANYLVRLQPELLRGGHYRIVLGVDASMVFPVQDRTTSAILSVFGAERDAGRRRHHGVDIFAPRGTPVLSATNGQVTEVQNTDIGGKIVWISDPEEKVSVYYAHLDSQTVLPGAEINRGAVLGFVGNTGNAITTSPHLHFGIYQNTEGPVDPYFYLYKPSQDLVSVSAPLEHLGSSVRTINEGIRLRDGPSRRAAVLDEMGEHTPMRVIAASGSWYRVRLFDGRIGFVASHLIETLSSPLRSEIVLEASVLLSNPSDDSPIMESIEAGSGILVLGALGGFLYIQSPRGINGWLAIDHVS